MRISFLAGIVIAAATAMGAAPQPRELAPGRQPQAAVDSKGRVHLVYADAEDSSTIWLGRSDDGGQTFAEPAKLPPLKQKMAIGMRRGPRIAAAGEALVLSYIAGDQGGGKDENLYTIRSTDGGKTWSEPLRVNTADKSAREGLHAMAAGEAGTLLLVWLDLRSGNMEVYGAMSSDSGKTWGPEVLVYRSPQGSVCECCHVSVTSDNSGGWLVMFRNNLDGNRDMYVVRSGDAKAWTQATKLGHESWKLPGCPMDGGALAAGERGAVAVYRRQSELLTCQISDPQKETRIGQGANAVIGLGAGGPIIAYLTNPARGDLMVLSGAHSARLAEGASDPVLVMPRPAPLLIWESNGRVFSAVLKEAERP